MRSRRCVAVSRFGHERRPDGRYAPVIVSDEQGQPSYPQSLVRGLLR
ncbi:hypothetical protein [Sulfitobacter sp.]|nr:hypothetical protein [Sulfitobacter sp.]